MKPLAASSRRAFGTHPSLRAAAALAPRRQQPPPSPRSPPPAPSAPPPLPPPSVSTPAPQTTSRNAAHPPAPPSPPPLASSSKPDLDALESGQADGHSQPEATTSSASSAAIASSNPAEGVPRAAVEAHREAKGPRVPLRDLPSFLTPFLPLGAAMLVTPPTDAPFELFDAGAFMAAAPAVVALPPRPLQRDVQALSLLQGLLPLSDWRHHPLLTQRYFAVPSSLLTAHVHQQVGVALACGQNGLDAFERLDAVVRRMKADRVEVPMRCAERLLFMALGKKSELRSAGSRANVSVDRLRERSKADSERLQQTWDMLFKDVSPDDIPFDRPAELDAPSTAAVGSSSSGPDDASGSQTRFNSPHAPLPAPLLRPSRTAFDHLLRLPHTAQTFTHLLALSPLGSGAHLPSVLSHLNRSYATVPAHLPAILSDPDLELSTRAINEILLAFTADENIHLNVPFEAYVAFRRHAAGLPWRRTYIARAAQGMYHNYDDALVSFANPILDSMNYDFPPSAAPDRQTYTLMLRACIYRGDLTLALSIFRDMLDPNGMSLRLPGSAPGRAGRPPNTLRAFRPAVEDYTQFFTGFVRFGEVGTISAEARDYWTAHPEAYQRAGGGDVGELFEDLDTRERLLKTWEAGMGAETEEMEDPYVPGFGGDMPTSKQYAVNAATEAKRWTLQTLIILFRSFLALKPNASHAAPPRPQASFLPPIPPSRFRQGAQAPSARRILHLLRALHQCSSGHPRVIQSAWEAVEDKFGKGNAEGWVGWKVDGSLGKYLGGMGVRPRDWERNGRGGYEPTDD